MSYVEGEYLQSIHTDDGDGVVGKWNNEDERIDWIDDEARNAHEQKTAALGRTRSILMRELEPGCLVEFCRPGTTATTEQWHIGELINKRVDDTNTVIEYEVTDYDGNVVNSNLSILKLTLDRVRPPHTTGWTHDQCVALSSKILVSEHRVVTPVLDECRSICARWEAAQSHSARWAHDTCCCC